MTRGSMSRALVVALAPFALPMAAAAADAPPSGVVSLAASATVEVPKDLMVVTLRTTREGPDPQSVQAALKQALDAALAEARHAARPGQLDVRTGGFSLLPRTTPKGPIAGWIGTAELALEGRDMPAIGQLVGRIGTLTVGRVQYGLSRELREKTEAEVSAQAIERYRAKAAAAAQSFGYGGYVIREVNVSSGEGGPMPYGDGAMARMAVPASAEGAPLPVEAGKAAVTVSVSGTVQLLR